MHDFLLFICIHVHYDMTFGFSYYIFFTLRLIFSRFSSIVISHMFLSAMKVEYSKKFFVLLHKLLFLSMFMAGGPVYQCKRGGGGGNTPTAVKTLSTGWPGEEGQGGAKGESMLLLSWKLILIAGRAINSVYFCYFTTHLDLHYTIAIMCEQRYLNKVTQGEIRRDKEYCEIYDNNMNRRLIDIV